MNTTQLSTEAATMTIYPPEAQGRGAFDGGRITEIKPIPFPQETGGSRRIGPLLYWAWATAHGDGVIGMHPHQGFEIMSYVLEGSVGHTDTGGNSSRVSAGGAQVMQTGSGISHQEEMHGERTDFFQIWFEPNLRETLGHPPTYHDFEAEDFPVTEQDGVRLKPIIGGGGPVAIEAPVTVNEITVEPGASHTLTVPAHHALASVVVSGAGQWTGESLANAPRQVRERYFALSKVGSETELTLEATGDEPIRVVSVLTPLQVDYPLQF